MVLISESSTVELLCQDEIIYGTGNEIRIVRNEKEHILPFALCKKIHGIKIKNGGERILVFGEKHFMLFSVQKEHISLMSTGEVTDWISGAVLCAEDVFCLVTAHSVALKLKFHPFDKSFEIVKRSSCEDKSTLYCSFLLGDHWDDLIVFGGNAFGEVIIWQPKSSTSNAHSPLLHRISAHQGVIFSINVNLEFNLMTTTSDDRSVRFWNINAIDKGMIDWKKTSLLPYKSTYGHTARVFQAKIIKEKNQPFVISCGEDFCMCLWNLNGGLLQKMKHQLGSILDFTYDVTTKTIFASTSSGNILKYGIENYFTPITAKEIEFQGSNQEYLAKVKFLGTSHTVCITNKNNLVFKNIGSSVWEFFTEGSAYKCTVFEVFGDIVITAGYKIVTLYKFYNDELHKIFEGNIMNNIIRSLFIFSENEYLICDDSGLCKFSSDRFETFIEFQIPPGKERWITAALKIDMFLVLSNRQGNVMLFHQENGKFHLKSTIKHCHGYFGVTYMLIEKYFGDICYFRTCGHDSTIRTIKLDKTTNQINVVYTENVPVAWIERLYKSKGGDSTIVVGFNDNHFIVWQRKFDFLLQLPCGGGHRCWDFQINAGKNEINLIYIKNRRLHSFSGPLKNISNSKVKLNHHYWHIKPCNILQSIQIDNSSQILISGGEDNLLKFFKYTKDNDNLKMLTEMFLHISSIKAIEIVKTSAESWLIFSAGGRAQICVLQFNLSDFTVQEKCNFMLKSNDFNRKYQRNTQDIDFDPETRIMALQILQDNNQDNYKIFAGCSDGYIRSFIYADGVITFCSEIFYNRCILHVRLQQILEHKLLITCATDGILCLWDMEKFSKNSVPDFQHKLHESGINSVDIKIDNDVIYVVTGGDDQSVVVSKIKAEKKSFVVIEKKIINWLHSAQVNGIKISSCNQFLYSVGVDQQICKFNLSNLSLEKRLYTCVADVKGLELCNSSKSKNICIIYGCGLQTLQL